MSQENVKTLRGARYRVSLPPEGAAERRTLDERLFVRFPALYRLVATAIWRMPVGSRLRRAWIARTFARSIAAANRRDFEVLVIGLDPGIVYHPRADEPDPSPHVGRDAFERLTYGFVESFSEVTVEVLELIEAGDHVIASTVLHALPHGPGSAIAAGVSDTYVFVYKVRDGLVVEGWEYKTKQEALEAVGLSEQDAHAES
jgi:ketosteroid isomerase-like protein